MLWTFPSLVGSFTVQCHELNVGLTLVHGSWYARGGGGQLGYGIVSYCSSS